MSVEPEDAPERSQEEDAKPVEAVADPEPPKAEAEAPQAAPEGSQRPSPTNSTRGGPDAARQCRQLSGHFVCAAQTMKHHLNICLRYIGLMYQNFEDPAEL